MRNIFPLLTLSVLLLSGCVSCQDQIAFLDNGNSNPRILFVEIYGDDLWNAYLQAFSPGSTSSCLGDKAVDGDIEIEVRVATTDANNMVVIDPTPYSERVLGNLFFPEKNPLSSNQTGQIIEVDVPSEGAYLLRIQLTLDRCSSCCFGNNVPPAGDPRLCGTQTLGGSCRGGRPRAVFEEVFIQQDGQINRPPSNYNFSPSTNYSIRTCLCNNCLFDC